MLAEIHGARISGGTHSINQLSGLHNLFQKLLKFPFSCKKLPLLLKQALTAPIKSSQWTRHPGG